MTALPHNLVFEMLHREAILITVQRDDVTQAEWDQYIGFLETVADTAALCMLVYIEGGAPSVTNQQRIGKIARGRNWPVALVSPSLALRFVVSAFSLINRNIRYFTPAQMPEALRHIGCTANTNDAVERALGRLRQSS